LGFFHTDSQMSRRSAESQPAKTWSKSVKSIYAFAVGLIPEMSLGVMVKSWNKHQNMEWRAYLSLRLKGFVVQKLRIRTMFITLFDKQKQRIVYWRKNSEQWISLTDPGKLIEGDSKIEPAILRERLFLLCNNGHARSPMIVKCFWWIMVWWRSVTYVGHFRSSAHCMFSL
jgi:hypothetical protein